MTFQRRDLTVFSIYFPGIVTCLLDANTSVLSVNSAFPSSTHGIAFRDIVSEAPVKLGAPHGRGIPNLSLTRIRRSSSLFDLRLDSGQTLILSSKFIL